MKYTHTVWNLPKGWEMPCLVKEGSAGVAWRPTWPSSQDWEGRRRGNWKAWGLTGGHWSPGTGTWSEGKAARPRPLVSGKAQTQYSPQRVAPEGERGDQIDIQNFMTDLWKTMEENPCTFLARRTRKNNPTQNHNGEIQGEKESVHGRKNMPCTKEDHR